MPAGALDDRLRSLGVLRRRDDVSHAMPAGRCGARTDTIPFRRSAKAAIYMGSSLAERRSSSPCHRVRTTCCQRTDWLQVGLPIGGAIAGRQASPASNPHDPIGSPLPRSSARHRRRPGSATGSLQCSCRRSPPSSTRPRSLPFTQRPSARTARGFLSLVPLICRRSRFVNCATTIRYDEQPSVGHCTSLNTLSLSFHTFYCI